MEEENFNWVEQYLGIQSNKDIKNSSAFKTLIDNNIDTNELTGHEKETQAGIVHLNYKDEKEKETDSYDYAKGLLNFVKDMPEETVKALMLAGLNGVDVASNAAGVLFNTFTKTDPAMRAAFNNGDGKKFKESLNSNIKKFSNYLGTQKEEVRKIGEESETSSKAAEFVAMIAQDTPYAVPIYKKLKNTGVPNWMALPVAYGMGAGIAFDDDATIFLNSEQVQGFKKMAVDLENSSEEKIFNTTFRMAEGTGLGYLTAPIVKALKYAKNNIPKFAKPQSTITVGGAATAGALASTIPTDAEAINPKLAVQFLKEAGTTIQNLKKLKGGTGRSVFELDDEQVIKIAKMQRGLRENMNEMNDYMISSWRPRVIETGEDFVVVENVKRADNEVRKFLKPLQEFNSLDWFRRNEKLQDTMAKLGLDDFLNYDLLWNDFKAVRNWGKTKDGRIVLLDGGALDKTILDEMPEYISKNWSNILSSRRKEGMGKFIIMATAGGQGYRVLDNQQNNIISNKTEN
jgi:hypothetical protein